MLAVWNFQGKKWPFGFLALSSINERDHEILFFSDVRWCDYHTLVGDKARNRYQLIIVDFGFNSSAGKRRGL